MSRISILNKRNSNKNSECIPPSPPKNFALKSAYIAGWSSEIIEVHWKSMDAMFEWVPKMWEVVPEERRAELSGMQVIFYDYK